MRRPPYYDPSRDRVAQAMAPFVVSTRMFSFFGLGMRRPPPRIPDQTLIGRRPLYYAAGLLVIVSVLLQLPTLFVAGLLIAVLAVLPEIWYRFGLRALTFTHELSSSRAVFGDTVEVSLVVENRKALPLPWIEVADEYPDPLPVLGVHLDPAQSERAVLRMTLALWAYQRVRRRYRVRAVARGVYTFGPVGLRLSDPFGILMREERRTPGATLLVYPLVAPIERFGLSPRTPFGERSSPLRLLEDPLRVAGTRAYVPGDEPRRIHWKATARTGALQSKVYEPSSRHTVMIFLDVRTFTNVAMGYVPELAELAISAAASVARWALDQGYAVGLIANGTLAAVPEVAKDAPAAGGASGAEAGERPVAGARSEVDEQARLALALAAAARAFRLRVPPSPRPEQLTLILEGLARLQPYYGAPIGELIASEQHALAAGASVVYIGTERVVDVPAIVALRQLRARGHTVALLLTTADLSPKAGAASAADGHALGEAAHVLHLADLPTHYLGGRTTWNALVADVFGAGSLRRASSPVHPELSPRERQAVLEHIHLEALYTSSASPSSAPSTSGPGAAPAGTEGESDGTLASTAPRPGGPRALVLE